MAIDSGESLSLRCANHPDTETHLRCSRCGKPICVRCVIQTPVGGRCRQCANVRRLPVFQVGARLFARATAYGLVTALVAGFLWAQVGSLFGLSSLLLLLVGYGVGEAVSRGANRRIARSLTLLAGTLTVVAVVVGRAGTMLLRLPAGLPLGPKIEIAFGVGIGDLFGNIFGLLFLVLAVVIATSRVR